MCSVDNNSQNSNTKTSPLSLYSQYPLFVFEDINGEIRDKYRLFKYQFFSALETLAISA